MAQLLYSADCPYCRTVSNIIGFLDPSGFIERTPIESQSGRSQVESWHNGEYVHAPHLQYGNKFAYGVLPVGWRVLVALPFISIASTMNRAIETLRE